MWSCSHCSASNADSAVFCARCSEPYLPPLLGDDDSDDERERAQRRDDRRRAREQRERAAAAAASPPRSGEIESPSISVADEQPGAPSSARAAPEIVIDDDDDDDDDNEEDDGGDVYHVRDEDEKERGDLGRRRSSSQYGLAAPSGSNARRRSSSKQQQQQQQKMAQQLQQQRKMVEEARRSLVRGGSAAGGPGGVLGDEGAGVCRSAPLALALMLLAVAVALGLPFLVSDFANTADATGGDFPRAADGASLLSQPSAEVRSYDGYYNNPSHPDWGAAETTMLRRAPPTYSDGVYLPTARPATAAPRDISLSTMSGPTGLGSHNNVTALCVFFGQQVVEEMMDVQRPGCPIEYSNVGLAADDPLYAGAPAIPVTRSRFNQRTGRGVGNPRQQLNEASSLLDGGLFYSNFKAWADSLRTHEGGELRATGTWPPAGARYTRADGHEWDPSNHTSHSFPDINTIKLPFANPPPPTVHRIKPVSRFYVLGNPRGNENPMLLAMGVVWFREHNFQARRIRAAHPEYDDEEIFNEARKWTVALHQHVTVNEFYPAFARDMLPAYHGYEPEVHPGMSHLFQTSAMRFGHTMVPPGVYRRSRPANGTAASCEFYATSASTGSRPGMPAARTCNTYWNGQEHLREFEDDVEPWLMGMASQIAEREDRAVTEDLRGFVFGSLDFSRRDLMAINIQRGRDHGIPGYLDALRSFENATVPATFEELHSNATVVAELRRLYGDDLEQVDAFVGGLLASGADGPGELFKLVMRDQFQRVRDGDRFWYANLKNGLFTADEVADIERTKFSEIIIRNTDLGEGDIQENVFEWRPDEDARAVCEQPAQLSAEMLEECTPMQTYDYWTGSEAVIWASLASLAFFAAVCVAWLCGLAVKKDAKTGALRQLRGILAENEVHFLRPRGTARGGSPLVRAVESATLNAQRTAVYCRVTKDRSALLLERPADADGLDADDLISEAHERGAAPPSSRRHAGSASSRGPVPGVPGPAPSPNSSARGDPDAAGEGLVLHWPVRLREVVQVHRYCAGEHRPGGSAAGSAAPSVGASPQGSPPASASRSRTRSISDFFGGGGGGGGQPPSSASPSAAKDQRVAVDYMIQLHHTLEPSVFLSVHPEDDRRFASEMLPGLEVTEVGPEAWAQLLAAYTAERRTRVVRQARVRRFFEEAYALAAQYHRDDKARERRPPPASGREAREDRERQGEIVARLIGGFGADERSEERLIKRVRVNYAEFASVLGGRGAFATDNEYVRRLFEAARSCPLTPGAGGVTIEDGGRVEVSMASTLPFASFAAFIIEYTNERAHISIGALSRIFSMQLDPSPYGVDPAAAAERSAARPVQVAEMTRVLGAMLETGGQRLDEVSLRRVVKRLLRRAYLSGTRTTALSREDLSKCLNLGEDAAAAAGGESEAARDIDAEPDGGAAIQAPDPVRAGASYYLGVWRERRAAIFVLGVFYLAQVWIFASRFYDYGWLRENAGLRRNFGFGVGVTRAAASEQMFCMAVLLLTVSRNVLTKLRDTVLGSVADAAQDFHRHVAWNLVFWTATHVVGHTFNFASLVSQPANDLTCTFRNVYHSTDELPHLDYWLFRTVTGLTGYLLIPVMTLIYVFAADWARLCGRRCVRAPYRHFRATHSLWAVFYFLVLLHGSFALVQKPDFLYFVAGPLAVYLVDKFVTQARTASSQLAYGTELPGDVIRLQIERPPSISLTSGQYVKVSCGELDSTFHAFTVTSSPSDKLWMTLHVRVVGRWTTRLAQLVRDLRVQSQVPRGFRLRVDGPYGEGHQMWASYPESVLIGGGIGVTPFASILLDLQDRMVDGRLARSPVRRVSFVFIARSLTQWRWLEEIVRTTAQLDSRLALERGRAPIFRSYIFETRAQQLGPKGAGGVADFNQLRFHLASRVDAILLNRQHGSVMQRHSRRPKLVNVLRNIRDDALDDPRAAKQVRRAGGEGVVTGVFTCGPARLLDGVSDACSELNREPAALPHRFSSFSQAF